MMLHMVKVREILYNFPTVCITFSSQSSQKPGTASVITNNRKSKSISTGKANRIKSSIVETHKKNSKWKQTAS